MEGRIITSTVSFVALCISRLCILKLCILKLCISKLCISRLFISRLGISLLCAFSAPAFASDLERDIESILSRSHFRGSTFAILVRSLEDGREIYSLNAEKLMPPASTAKLVTSAGALATLGKDYRWRTNVVGTGNVREGILSGDLVLVASGDPNLSQRMDSSGRLQFRNKDHTYAGFTDASVVPGDPLEVLRKLARDVHRSGVREIRGDVIVDDGWYTETWDSFVGEFSAMCVNDNVIDITVTPDGSVGEKARCNFSPDLGVASAIVNAKIVAAGAETRLWVEKRPGLASFSIQGSIALDSKPVLCIGRLEKPAEVAAHFFKKLLERAGIDIKGGPRRSRFGPTIYKSRSVLAWHDSAPLSEALRVLMKVSHNLHATMLPVEIGARLTGKGDRVNGFRRIHDFFGSAGLDVDSVILQSGSGGGRVDRLSPRFLVDLLTLMRERSDFLTFYDILPVAGVDGTLASRFRSSPLRARIRAKTGTLLYKGSFNDRWIYESKALAGYVDLRQGNDKGDKGDSGEMLAFSICISGMVCKDRKEGVDRLFDAQVNILEVVARSRGFSP